jgi:PIN domain nuclease of toxin-antitoxin system
VTDLLLDTHAFVWAISAPDRLSQSARSVVEDPSNRLLVSAATAWELATKTRLDRFPEAEPIVAQYRELVEALGAQELAVTSAHALRAGGLRWDHRDPFDRMLAAQALLEHATLISRDRAFEELAGLDLVW